MSKDEPKIWWLLYVLIGAPVALLSMAVLMAGPLLLSEQLGLLVIPLWIGWWIAINRIYAGWQKIRELQTEIEFRQGRVLEASRTLNNWKPGPYQGTLGNPSQEDLQARLDSLLRELAVSKARLPSTIDGWFRVLLMKADPPGIANP
jgi:hypothetical protein